MMVFWCRKHGFCPQGRQLAHCEAQNKHQGCVNLAELPTKHPPCNRPRKRKWRAEPCMYAIASSAAGTQ